MVTMASVRMSAAIGMWFFRNPSRTSMTLHSTMERSASIDSLPLLMRISASPSIGTEAMFAFRPLIATAGTLSAGKSRPHRISIGICILPRLLLAISVCAFACISIFLCLSVIPIWSSPNAKVSLETLPAMNRLSIRIPILLRMFLSVFRRPLSLACLRSAIAKIVSLLSVYTTCGCFVRLILPSFSSGKLLPSSSAEVVSDENLKMSQFALPSWYLCMNILGLLS